MYHELLHFRTDCRVKIGDQGAFVEATVDSETVKSGEELVYRPGFLVYGVSWRLHIARRGCRTISLGLRRD